MKNHPLIELGINIDHVATLSNARGTVYPDPIRAALEAEQAGADLITLHLREDRRHIKDADLRALRPLIKTRMNLECAITNEMLQIACEVSPHEEVTTEGGLDVIGHYSDVEKAVQLLHSQGIRVSLFIDPDIKVLDAAKNLGVQVVELHTGRYADASITEVDHELQRIQEAAMYGHQLGLRVNAGHGLNESNVLPIAKINTIAELNIGHAIVAQAIFKGWKTAISDMKSLINQARG